MRCAWCGTPTRTKKTHRLHTKNCIKRQYCVSCGAFKGLHPDKFKGYWLPKRCEFVEPPRKYPVHGRLTPLQRFQLERGIG